MSPRSSAGPIAEVSDGPRHPLDVLEMATATLVRNFELMRRRSDIYTQLDRSEYLLLRTLDLQGPLDVYSLATAVGLDPSTAGRQVGVMHGRALVKRAPAANDRRRSIISPTAKGHRYMQATRLRIRQVLAELLHDWTEPDLWTLADMYTRFNQAVADRYVSSDPG